MAEEKENIVRKTVRMELGLSDRLNDYVLDLGRGLPPKDRPTIDAVIQQAVRALLEAAISQRSPHRVLSPSTISGTERSGTLQSDLSEDERAEVDRLLLILRKASERKRQAIRSNLAAFAEDVESQGGHGASGKYQGDRMAEFADKLADIIAGAEKLGENETTRKQWLEATRHLQEELAELRGATPGTGTGHRPTGTGDRKRPRGRSKH